MTDHSPHENNSSHPAISNQAPLFTDDQARSALWSAGIPAGYHGKTRSLQTLQNCSAVDAAQAWLTDAKVNAALGGCLDITFDGATGMDFSFLLARAMVLRGIAISVISLPNWVSICNDKYMPRHADWLEDAHGRDYLMVLGSLGSGSPPYSDEKLFEAEWGLRSWMLHGKPLIMQGASSMDACQWWSAGFSDLFISRRSASFESGVTKIKGRSRA